MTPVGADRLGLEPRAQRPESRSALATRLGGRAALTGARRIAYLALAEAVLVLGLLVAASSNGLRDASAHPPSATARRMVATGSEPTRVRLVGPAGGQRRDAVRRAAAVGFFTGPLRGTAGGSIFAGLENPQASYAVVLTNATRGLLAVDVHMTFTFLDASGRPVVVIHDAVAAIPPGSTTAVGRTDTAARIGEEKRDIRTATRIRFSARVGSWRRFDAPSGTLRTIRAETNTDTVSSEMSTLVTIQSTFRQAVHNVEFVAVYRYSNGAIAGGNWGCKDPVDPGASNVGETQRSEVIPHVASTRAYVHWKLPRSGELPDPGCD